MLYITVVPDIYFVKNPSKISSFTGFMPVLS